ADAFGEVLYFSYLPESLEEFTSDPALLRRVRVFAPAQPMSRGRRALTMVTAHADEFRRCRALRVFQITGTIPARRATKRFGIPYVTTYGFWYAQLSAPGLMGRLRRPVEALARARQVEIKFPGIVEQAKLPAVYGSADVFVLASFTEGHPKVLLEAMASGVPCVASDCAGNRSLITDGETGLLFDPHRPDELAERLRRILDDPALAARLGKAGRALVAERYDLGALVQREIELVRSVARR